VVGAVGVVDVIVGEAGVVAVIKDFCTWWQRFNQATLNNALTRYVDFRLESKVLQHVIFSVICNMLSVK